MGIVGCRSIEAAQSGYEAFKDRLCKEGICIEENANLEIQNIVATSDVRRNIDFERLTGDVFKIK